MCRVAVLVDGDNVAPRHAHAILALAATLGRVDVARVYAAVPVPADWLAMPGYRLIHAGAGKNATDLLLSIDGIELAHLEGIESFVLATSDRDFTHLAQRLRERGRHVQGMGEDKAPEAFRRACSAFARLPARPAAAVARAPAVPPAQPDPSIDLDRLPSLVAEIVAEATGDGATLRIAVLSTRMHQRHGVRIGDTPQKTWRGYLTAHPALFEIDAPAPDAAVRLRAVSPEATGHSPCDEAPAGTRD